MRTLILFLVLTIPFAIAQEPTSFNPEDAAAILEGGDASGTAAATTAATADTTTDMTTGEPTTEPATGADVASTDSRQKTSMGLIGMLRAGGVVGFVLFLLSLVAVALAIEHALSIRRGVLLPQGLADQVLGLLNAGQWAQALQRCREDPSALGQTLAAGLGECELGWSAVEKGAEESLAEQAARLYRKVEYLNVVGNIAPMLGLLGTVLGMVYAFQELAGSQGYARASDLAEGIYLALITTVQGLIVAIPALAVYAYFCNRIASLVAETAHAASQVLLPVKKRLAARSPRP